jgi:dienelactone hydrolase
VGLDGRASIAPLLEYE